MSGPGQGWGLPPLDEAGPLDQERGPPRHKGPLRPAPAPIWVPSVSFSLGQERVALWEYEKQPQGQAGCRQAWLGPSREGAFLMRKQLGLHPPSGGAGPPGSGRALPPGCD